jgi:hypothetical protein
MARCAGIKADGGRCRAQAIRDSQWCFNHHPDYEKARRQRASKGGKRGGRGRSHAELVALKDKLIALGEDVLEGRVDRGNGAVVAQIWNVAIGAIRTGLKAKEVEELEERLSELEDVLAQKKDASAWG